ncbi:MAG TPA: argininosuccinate lyase [Gaiellales bacterium]|nr:argininosuccinate lyase [Gaiellales bacterium]
MWAGRVRAALDPDILAFSRSLPVDRALLAYDVLASQVHVRMLERVGLLDEAEAAALVQALSEVPAVPEDAPDEDVHSYLERCLTEKLGALGRKVHAGRSRNDQVAVATRMWAKDAARELALGVAAAQEALITCARANQGAVLPGYTHLQRAQPVLLGHHLAAHAWMLERDAERLRAAYSSADECPLGAGALAGSSLPLDPQWTAGQLGFARSFDNTLDAVADRDFICDLLYACAVGFVHLSRLAEEVVLFTTQEFAFAELDDTVALGSSIMPQKKNPQVAEHLRGRAGVAIGRLAAMLAVCKGLPLAYDSDLQEDKELAFAQVAAFDGALRATALLVAGLHFDAERMREAAADGATVATDVAEALVRGGMPFREAHEQVASRIAGGERFSEPTPEEAIAARNAPGGTSPQRVEEQLAALTWRIAATRAWAKA